jgi:glycosyltransferase involved in cell wall biosynthesis
MITLITPTGCRQLQFSFCQHFMKNQTYTGEVTWIIVDDCEPKTTDLVKEDFRDNWTIKKVYPSPKWKQGMNTQGRNIKAGLDAMPKNTEVIFIIEDDDCYKPIYLEKMMHYIKGYDAAGEVNTIYYNVPLGAFAANNNTQHASLFQLAFRSSLLPAFISCLGEKFIDFVFCAKIKSLNLFKEDFMAIGIKGLQGRGGIGAGHSGGMFQRSDTKDRHMNWLKNQIGADFELYAKWNKEYKLLTHASFYRHG